MTLPVQELPARKQLVGTITQNPPVQENPSIDTNQKDPLIARGWEDVVYIGVFAIAIAVIGIVGFFSRKLEYAIFASIVLSVALIVFFLTV